MHGRRVPHGLTGPPEFRPWGQHVKLRTPSAWSWESRNDRPPLQQVTSSWQHPSTICTTWWMPRNIYAAEATTTPRSEGCPASSDELKAARPARTRVHVIADFGPDTHFLQKYHVRDDALFLDSVYTVFRGRELFGRVTERHGARSEQMLAEVSGALVGSRGCCDRPAKRRK